MGGKGRRKLCSHRPLRRLIPDKVRKAQKPQEVMEAESNFCLRLQRNPQIPFHYTGKFPRLIPCLT